MIESIWAVGFSGNRELDNPELVRQKLFQLVENLSRDTRGRLIAISSIAIGADIIFVETCLAQNLPWIAILPVRPSLFFNENDFPDGTSRAQAMALLARATSVEIISSDGHNTFTDQRYREIAFGNCGERIVEYSDVFIAALWPENGAVKAGGTSEIVNRARRSKRPLAIVHTDDGRVEHHHWSGQHPHRLVTELAALPEDPTQDTKCLDRTLGYRSVRDWFGRASNAASRRVPRLRNISSLAVILHAIGVMLALALIAMPPLFRPPPTKLVADWIKVVVASAAFAATIWFIFGKPHLRAARYRLCAEISRSILAAWDFPRTHRQIFGSLPSEYQGLIRMLLNFRRLEGPKPGDLTAENEEPAENWKHFVSRYVDDRIDEQINYYSREQEKARRRIKILEPLSWLFSLAGLLLAIAVAIASAWRDSIPLQFEGFVNFAKVAFPFAAGTCVGLLAVREATRRKSRYGEMLAILKENAERLTLARYRETAEEVIIDNERSLLAENVEWANAAKYPATG